MANYISVGQLNNYLKRKFEVDPHLEHVYLKGEISNSKLDIINSSQSVFKITHSNNKETSEPNSLLITNGKTMTPNFLDIFWHILSSCVVR